eukprot:5503686-Heterocapsa_arctica.AAC.1
MKLGLITGLQDHRPGSLEWSPGKWNVRWHEEIYENKEIRSQDGRFSEYYTQLNMKQISAQTTGKRSPKHRNLVAHRDTKHGEREGKDEFGEEKNEKL